MKKDITFIILIRTHRLNCIISRDTFSVFDQHQIEYSNNDDQE